MITTKKNIIKDRLVENNIEVKKLLDEIIVFDEGFIVLYTSQIDGLGSAESDFDVYVVSCQEQGMDLPEGKSVFINGIEFDIEYHCLSGIVCFFANYNGGHVDLRYLSFLLRILNGDVIHSSDSNVVNISEYIDINKIRRMGVETYLYFARGSYDDALKMYNLTEHVSGLVLARNALTSITMAINVINDDYVFKEKWQCRQLKTNVVN